MRILYKKSLLVEVTSVEELEKFIINKQFYKYFIKFPEDFKSEIQYNIDNTKVLPYKEVKKFIRNILKYPESINNPLFLYSMGWNESDINKFISEKQKYNSNKLKIRKKENPGLYFSSTTSRIEYWLDKGYDITSAKKMLSKRQSTFSRKICIEKYGKELGESIFQERQKKWITSLKKNHRYDEINKEKNSYKYDDENYLELIDRTSFLEKTKKIILNHINNKTLDEFILNILIDVDPKRYSDIHPFINSKIIQHKFKKTKEDIRENFFHKIGTSLTKQTYGVPVYYGGIRYKSIKEYEIALFLTKNNIKFIYEKNYPNSLFKFDFFLTDKNTYVEYFGMLENKNLEKLDDRQVFYREKMLLKISFCKENNLDLLYSVNHKELINLIKKLI